MKKNLVLIAIIAFSFQINSQNKINWLSFEEAIALNKEEPKQILIQVYADWCGYCKKMNKETYSNNVIINYINDNFYAVKLNGEGKADIEYKGYTFKYKKQGRSGYHELAAALLEGKMSYPTSIFMNDKEQLLQKIPGYLPKEQFEVILAYFKTNSYIDKEWADFEKNFKSNL